MDTLQTTSFLEAKRLFQDFLVKQNLSHDIVWLFREDIIPHEKSVLVKTPLPSENERLAERYYEVGRKRGLGLCLLAFALLDSHLCCYIQLPLDEVDAEQMMMSNQDIKYSVRTDLLKAQPISSSLAWTAYQLSQRVFGASEFLPSNMPNKSSFADRN